jgi:hypothetical protein
MGKNIRVTPAKNGEVSAIKTDGNQVKNPHHNSSVSYDLNSDAVQGSRGGLTTRSGRRAYH